MQDYAQDTDDSVVGDAIDAIGRIAHLVPPSTPQCLSALMGMINSKQGQYCLSIFLIAEADYFCRHHCL